MSFLSIENLYKNYGPIGVLKDINITVNEGDFLVLVGPSGCGKSTLLYTIAGLESISGGTVAIDGRVVNDLPPSKRDIAMVFQSYALYPTMNVADNIGFGMEMRGVAKSDRANAINEAAKTLQIEHLLDRRPAQLSGGQRQRVAMGRALVRKPRLFLFDEPLSNLDAKLRIDMRTEIKRLHQSLGTTIVYVTHDQIEAMTLATSIAVLRDGVLQQFGTPAEIYNNPANRFVADFMGSPSMNLFPVRVVGGDDAAIIIEREDDDALRLAIDPKSTIAKAAGDRNLILGLRPEAITEATTDGTATGTVTADCLVDIVEPAGADTYVVTNLAGVEVVARMGADCQLTPGKKAPFAFCLDKAVLFDAETNERVA